MTATFCPDCGSENIKQARGPRRPLAGIVECECGLQFGGLPQPAHRLHQRNVAPRGPIVRQEDAFPESCCEGSSTEGKGDRDTP